jgi:hypothetical protein
MCVILANEPRYEREVLAAALCALRPGIDVVGLTPDRLDGALAALRPQLVVCSEATTAVRAHAPAWVLLYPDDAAHAVVCLDGIEAIVPGFDLAALVATVDTAARMRSGTGGRTGDVDDHDVG